MEKRFEVELPEEVLACFGWQKADVPRRVREALVMDLCGEREARHRSWDRPLYAFRGGLRGAGASSTESKIAANIERGF